MGGVGWGIDQILDQVAAKRIDRFIFRLNGPMIACRGRTFTGKSFSMMGIWLVTDENGKSIGLKSRRHKPAWSPPDLDR